MASKIIPPLNLNVLKQHTPLSTLFRSNLSPIVVATDRELIDKEVKGIVAEFSIDSESSLLSHNSQLDQAIIEQSSKDVKSLGMSSNNQSLAFIRVDEGESQEEGFEAG